MHRAQPHKRAEEPEILRLPCPLWTLCLNDQVRHSTRFKEDANAKMHAIRKLWLVYGTQDVFLCKRPRCKVSRHAVNNAVAVASPVTNERIALLRTIVSLELQSTDVINNPPDIEECVIVQNIATIFRSYNKPFASTLAANGV